MTRYSEQEEWASLYCEGGEALAQVAQRSCGCPLPGSVQGQVGWGLEHPGLVEGVPAHGRGVGTRWSVRSLPTQTIQRFYEKTWTLCHLWVPPLLAHRLKGRITEWEGRGPTHQRCGVRVRASHARSKGSLHLRVLLLIANSYSLTTVFAASAHPCSCAASLPTAWKGRGDLFPHAYWFREQYLTFKWGTVGKHLQLPYLQLCASLANTQVFCLSLQSTDLQNPLSESLWMWLDKILFPEYFFFLNRLSRYSE